MPLLKTRQHSLLELATTSVEDGILVVDRSGKIAPLTERPDRIWRMPHGGKTMPLNQRFAQMWQMPAKFVSRVMAENSLRRSLAREELTVFYQPQANLATGQIDSAEALVRWRHPSRGLVLPDDFIPLAEETGLIISLGEWVLRAACSQNEAWLRAGLSPLRIAVNLSALQLEQPNLVRMVADVLRETHLGPESLELEITESTTMRSPDRAINALHELRDLGVQISMDDFGVGYSSLAHLRDLPIHTLKIDRSLIAGITRSSNDAAIVTAIIAMANSLNLEVVAEGVETQDQLAFLVDLKCHRYQGFLLSRPIPPEQLFSMLSRPQTDQAA
ncbi:MAG: EAL domain-containing protein [Chloroflexi bacterium]|nr:EAL domain-containing protein [Chloroflexota bacterium]